MHLQFMIHGLAFMAAAQLAAEPMSGQKLITFLLYAVTTTFTPGPNNIMSMTLASSMGFKRALRYCFGVFLGFFLLLALAAAFSTLLGEFIPRVEFVMKLIGALYILYLAVLIIRDKPRGDKAEKKHALRPDSVITGAVVQFVNPKGILYGLVCMSTYVMPHYKNNVPMIALFGLMLAGIALASTTCWGLCGSVFERVFQKHKKALNIVMALLLVYCAVALFL